MNILSKFLDVMFPTIKGHWEDVTVTKVEAFRNMKQEEFEARRADSYGMHPVIIRGHQESAIHYRNLIEEMELLGTDSVKSRKWVADAKEVA